MAHKIVEQWNFNGISVLRLDKAKVVKTASDDYRLCRINRIIYEPCLMSHPDGRFISIKGEGDFVGKEVEFIKAHGGEQC